jgi:hypothetical protein
MTRKLFVTTGADGRLVVSHARPHGELGTDDPDQLRAATAAEHYRATWGTDRVLDWFEGQNGFSHLFDSSPDAPTDLTRPANRVVAAWGRSRPDERVGDRRLLRRFPLPARRARQLDRGHLIALASGGGENVNLVPQATRLNRGWSEQGRRWRALERLAASQPGVSMFIEVRYDDLSDVPSTFLVHARAPGGPELTEEFANHDLPTAHAERQHPNTAPREDGAPG